MGCHHQSVLREEDVTLLLSPKGVTEGRRLRPAPFYRQAARSRPPPSHPWEVMRERDRLRRLRDKGFGV
jgi:hypothetical protein